VTERQRGPHPEDPKDFSERYHDVLRRAVSELSWLLTRGYPPETALKFVGDRYQLRKRQRIAVGSCSVGDAQLEQRLSRRLPPGDVSGRTLRIDGFNAIITLEAALSGALVIRGRDRVWRDLSRVSGSYKRVKQTEQAIALLGQTAAELGITTCEWCLDKHVSNSGRLRAALQAHGAAQGWTWTARLTERTDPEIAAAPDVAVSSDSWILDRASAWLDLAGETVRRHVPDAWRFDTAPESA